MPERSDIEEQIAAFKQRIESNLLKARAGNYQVQKVNARYQRILDTALSQELFVNVFDKILTDPSILEQAKNLKPGESINIKRPPNSKQLRTFSINMDESGEIYLFIEPKSKRFDNTRRMVEWIGGAFKTRKISVRADQPEGKVYVSLIQYIEDTDKAQERVLKELAITKMFSGKPGFIPHCIFGGAKVKHHKDKDGKVKLMRRVITYAPYMPSNLDDFLKNKWSPPGVLFEPEELKALKYDIMRQIVDIVATLHDRGIEHKDLKPDNLLLDYNETTARFEVQVIDFGVAQKFGEEERANGTGPYMPAWLIKLACGGFTWGEIEGKKIPGKIYTDEKLAISKKLKERFSSSLGWLLLKRTLKETDIIPDTTKERRPLAGEHDVWSLGIICHQLMFGAYANPDVPDKKREKFTPEQMEQNIINNPLLQKLFNLFSDDPSDTEVTKAIKREMAIERNNLPSVDLVKEAIEEAFEEDPEIVSVLAHLPDPKDIMVQEIDSSIDERYARKIFDDEFPNIFQNVVDYNDYATKMDLLIGRGAVQSQEDKRFLVNNFLMISPAAIDANQYTIKHFKKEYDNETDIAKTFISGYELMRSFGSYMIAPKKIADLEKYAAKLQTLLDKLVLVRGGNYDTDAMSKVEWLKFARWQLFLRTALCLTEMRIVDLQGKAMIKRPQTTWLLSSRISSRFYSLFKPKPQKSVNYAQEIIAQQKAIEELVRNLKQEIKAANFESTFANRY